MGMSITVCSDTRARQRRLPRRTDAPIALASVVVLDVALYRSFLPLAPPPSRAPGLSAPCADRPSATAPPAVHRPHLNHARFPAL